VQRTYSEYLCSAGKLPESPRSDNVILASMGTSAFTIFTARTELNPSVLALYALGRADGKARKLTGTLRLHVANYFGERYEGSSVNH
jgi:hypothetical protein